MTERPRPTGALAQMLAETGEFDRIMEHGLTFNRTPGPEPEPPGLSIQELMSLEPVDWHEEQARALQAERRQQTRALEPELTALAGEDTEPRPARPRRWTREQLRGH